MSFPPSPLERAKRLADWHKQCRDAEDDNDPRNWNADSLRSRS